MDFLFKYDIMLIASCVFPDGQQIEFLYQSCVSRSGFYILFPAD